MKAANRQWQPYDMNHIIIPLYQPYDLFHKFNLLNCEHKKSINLFISSFDSIAETTMDFGLTFIMRLRWQDPRMMFPDIEGEKMLDNKTILTMDLKFLEELWVPGTC